MNAQKIKPNSFLTALLQALADGAITTIDDLQTRMDEPRKRLLDNTMHASKRNLIRRLRDEVTGNPAYQITSLGREHLATAAGNQLKEAAPTPVPAAKIGAIADWVNQCEKHPGEEIALEVLESKPDRVAVEVATPRTSIDVPMPPATATETYVTSADVSLEYHLSLESARKRALAIACNGERTVVYKLVPVGTAVPAPGAEWAAA